MTPLERLTADFHSRPGAVALVADDVSFTRGELLREAAARAQAWRELGLREGARILLPSKDRVEYLVSFLAASIGGFSIVSVSQKATEEEVRHVRELSRPDLVWDPGSAPAGGESPDRPPAFRDVPVLFFTSGTTSLPKGVRHRFANLVANAEAFNETALLTESVRMLHVMPTGYMAGVLNTFLSPLAAGGCAILGLPFDAASSLSFWTRPRRHGANAVWLSPTMAATLARVLRDDTVPAWTASNLRHVFVGTAALHPSTRERFRAVFGVDCLQSYGMTECMFVSVNPPGSPPDLESVGIPIRGVELATRRDGDPDSYGTESSGDLLVRSPYVMDGYLGSGEPGEPATEWLETGDIAEIEPSGHVRITGRRKDLIIRGGLNLSPRRIEDALLSIPGVVESVVTGQPDPFWGEVPIAWIVLEPSAAWDEPAAKEIVRARLGGDSVPARFHRLPALPRNGSGKVATALLAPAGEPAP